MKPQQPTYQLSPQSHIIHGSIVPKTLMAQLWSSLLHTQLSTMILSHKPSPKKAEDWPKAHSVVSTTWMVKIKISKPMGCTPPSSQHPIFCSPEDKPEIKIHIQKETEPSGKLHTWQAGCAHSLATACSFLSMWKAHRALVFARIEKNESFCFRHIPIFTC